ncbi:hypothetical protein MP638_007358 [Amoeboaphelidium occidentale]|nr:hypothetical protein MP638_007358 [Amoeboaphelidium occidentale]
MALEFVLRIGLTGTLTRLNVQNIDLRLDRDHPLTERLHMFEIRIKDPSEVIDIDIKLSEPCTLTLSSVAAGWIYDGKDYQRVNEAVNGLPGSRWRYVLSTEDKKQYTFGCTASSRDLSCLPSEINKYYKVKQDNSNVFYEDDDIDGMNPQWEGCFESVESFIQARPVLSFNLSSVTRRFGIIDYDFRKAKNLIKVDKLPVSLSKNLVKVDKLPVSLCKYGADATSKSLTETPWKSYGLLPNNRRSFVDYMKKFGFFYDNMTGIEKETEELAREEEDTEALKDAQRRYRLGYIMFIYFSIVIELSVIWFYCKDAWRHFTWKGIKRFNKD